MEKVAGSAPELVTPLQFVPSSDSCHCSVPTFSDAVSVTVLPAHTSVALAVTFSSATGQFDEQVPPPQKMLEGQALPQTPQCVEFVRGFTQPAPGQSTSPGPGQAQDEPVHC